MHKTLAHVTAIGYSNDTNNAIRGNKMISKHEVGTTTVQQYKREEVYIQAVCSLIGKTVAQVNADMTYLRIQEWMDYGATPEETAAQAFK